MLFWRRICSRQFVIQVEMTKMSRALWYYMTSGWFRKTRRVGPITEADLLHLIDHGKIAPDTLLQSTKTKNQWVPMNQVGPAMEHYRLKHPTTKAGDADGASSKTGNSRTGDSRTGDSRTGKLKNGASELDNTAKLH
jgi:hypothetical protein